MMDNSWLLFEDAVNAWCEGDLFDRDIRELERIDWDGIDDYSIQNKLIDNARFRRDLHRFAEYLAPLAIANGWHNTAALLLRLNLLSINATNTFVEASGQLLKDFWKLLAICPTSNFIKYNAQMGTFTVGNRVVNAFNIELVNPTEKPQVLSRYASDLSSDRRIQGHAFAKLKLQLDQCEAGKAESARFEKIGIQAFQTLFNNALDKPRVQQLSHDRTKRRDAIFPIRHDVPDLNEFWKKLIKKYSTYNIVLDSKNYSKPVTPDDIRQIRDYLNPLLGSVGIIWTRGLADNSSTTLNEQIAAFKEHNKLILIITDEIVLRMSHRLDNGEPPELELNAIEFEFICKYR